MLGKANSLDHSPAGDAIIAPYIVICMYLSVVTVTVLVLGIIRIEESTVLTCVVFIHADILSRLPYVRSAKSANRSRRPSTPYTVLRVKLSSRLAKLAHYMNIPAAEKFTSSYTSQYIYIKLRWQRITKLHFTTSPNYTQPMPQVRYQNSSGLYLVTPH